MNLENKSCSTRIITKITMTVFVSFCILTIFDSGTAFADDHDEGNDDYIDDETEYDYGEYEEEWMDYESEGGDGSLEQYVGTSSSISVDPEDGGRLEIRISNGDMEDGLFDVVFLCKAHDVGMMFYQALEISDGHGEKKINIALEEGEYSGCEVQVGELLAEFPGFAVTVQDDSDKQSEYVDNSEEEEGYEESYVGPEHAGEQEPVFPFQQTVSEAGDYAVIAEEHGAVIINALENHRANENATDAVFFSDSPDEGELLLVSQAYSMLPATVIVNYDNTISYEPQVEIPNSMTNVTDQIHYNIVSASTGAVTDAGVITVTILPANDPPVAIDSNYTKSRMEEMTFYLTGHDNDGDDLKYSLVSVPRAGVVAEFNETTGAVTYRTGELFVGEAHFAFTVSDSFAESMPARVIVNVIGSQEAVNDT